LLTDRSEKSTLPHVGRKRAFDPEAALERAMEVFWLKGFQSTSVSDLLAAMEINRFSMYQTFGGKDELFVAALELYRGRWSAMIAEHLSRTGPARAVLAELLREMGRQILTDKLGRGCLVANSAVEVRWLGAEAAALVRRSVDGLEDAFTRTLERAAAEGDLRPGRDARVHARFLVATMNGIRDVAKLDPDRKRIHGLVELLIETL
jgi:TetR/AcrR family transcriptional repressor of nem operon